MTKSWTVFALVANLSASEAMSIQQYPQSLSQAQWAIPCKNNLCVKMMQSLNPRNDWIRDNYDQLDNENDDQYWDPNKKVKHLHQHGSDQYGHVTSKIGGVVGLHQMHKSDTTHKKKGKKLHKKLRKFKDDSEDSQDDDPKEKHDKPKHIEIKKKKEKKEKLKKKAFDSDEDEEAKEIRKDLKEEEDAKEAEKMELHSSDQDEVDKSDHKSTDDEDPKAPKKKHHYKSKNRARKDADRTGNLKHNVKAENLHKYKSEEQDAFDEKEKGSFISDDDRLEKKLAKEKHGVRATLQDANMAIQGVRKVSGEISKQHEKPIKHQKGMKASDSEEKSHKKKKTAEDDESDYSEDLHKNIQKATKKNLKDAEKMRSKTKKADYSSDKEEENDDDSKKVKSIGEKLKELKLADQSIKNDLQNGKSKGTSAPEDESEIQVAENLIKKIHLKAENTEKLIKKDIDKIHEVNLEKVHSGYEPHWGTLKNSLAEVPMPSSNSTNLVQQLGLDKQSLRNNLEYYEVKGKLIQTSKFRTNALSVPSVDTMMDENSDIKSLEQDLKYNFGV